MNAAEFIKKMYIELSGMNTWYVPLKIWVYVGDSSLEVAKVKDVSLVRRGIDYSLEITMEIEGK